MIAERSSRYGRHCRIWLALAPCDKCGRREPCLAIDTSDDEYGPGYICRFCASGAFESGEPVVPVGTHWDDDESAWVPERTASPTDIPATMTALTAVFKRAYSKGGDK